MFFLGGRLSPGVQYSCSSRGKHFQRTNPKIFELYKKTTFSLVFSKKTRIDMCLNSTSATCSSITEEECDYKGKYINNVTTQDENQCQQLCEECSLPDCEYWSFDRSNKNCILWELPTRQCLALGGPKEPQFLQCIGKYKLLISAI